MTTSSLRARSARRLAALLVAGLAVAACDTGDGKTLRDPTGTLPPTTPPPTTTELPRDGVGTLPSLPLEDPATDDAGEVGDIGGVANEFRLFAPWADGDTIDTLYTCDGSGISPPLSWTQPPEGTIELAVSMVDESITNGPPFIHWVIAGIAPDDISLIEGGVPVGAIQGLNFFGDVGYGGPCPPSTDEAHDYRVTVYALGQQTELADGTPARDLLDFVEAVAFETADSVGTYGR